MTDVFKLLTLSLISLNNGCYYIIDDDDDDVNGANKFYLKQLYFFSGFNSGPANKS